MIAGESLGCFKDNWVRDLDGAFNFDYFTNCPSKCVQLCSSYFYKYSGVQFGYILYKQGK